MAIFAKPVGTRPSSTLMGRVLPGLIRNRVGYGFLKKNPKRVRVGSRFYQKTRDSTRNPARLKTRYPKLQKYPFSLSLSLSIYIYNLTLIPHFFSLPPSVRHSPLVAMATTKQQQTEGGGGGLNLAHFWVLLAWVLGLDQWLFLGFAHVGLGFRSMVVSRFLNTAKATAQPNPLICPLRTHTLFLSLNGDRTQICSLISPEPSQAH